MSGTYSEKHGFLNPHRGTEPRVALAIDWEGEIRHSIEATDWTWRSFPPFAGSPKLADALPLQVYEFRDATSWDAATPNDRVVEALESGSIVFMPELSFALEGDEQELLDPSIANTSSSKNVSFDPEDGSVGGAQGEGADRDRLARLLERYHSRSRTLLERLFPAYGPHLVAGRSSFRPLAIGGGEVKSWRADDRRLHVDAFPRRPAQGRRILRVFSNVNRSGEPRLWVIGGPFTEAANRFLPLAARIPTTAMRRLPWPAWALQGLGLTKGRRTEYDRLMLGLHDEMKADDAYQQGGVRRTFSFPAGSSWIVFTDMVPHAAIAGQHALEQTFYLPVEAMHHPERSPLRILETLTHRTLAEPART
jgi:hypothetical protein